MQDNQHGKNETSGLGWVITYTITLAAILSGCNPGSSTPLGKEGALGHSVPVDGGGFYTDSLPQELKAMLEDKDFTFINVHIPEEGEIPKTDAHIPYDQVERWLDQFPTDKQSKIVLYCRSGSMSAIAARELVRLGYNNVYNLDGGFRAWSAAGFPFGPRD